MGFVLAVAGGMSAQTDSTAAAPASGTVPPPAPLPPGLSPQVDVMWGVMSQKDCSDAFGTRVAQSLYCIQLTLGNNSGYQLKVSRVGFYNSALYSTPGSPPAVTITNNSYKSTRAVLLKENITNGRNILYNVIQGTGVTMAGLTPYFGTGKHPNGTVNNARTNWTTAASIVSGPLLSAFNIVAPNQVITQLNNLDDESLRDGQILTANDQTPALVVFVSKEQLTWPLSRLLTLYPDLRNYTGAADQQSIPKKHATATSTVDNSHNSHHFKRGGFSPYLVELALGNLVIVGQPIQYLPRVQITTTSPAGPLSAAPSSLSYNVAPNGVTRGAAQTVTLTNTGTSAITGIKPQIAGSSDFALASVNSADACPTSLAPSAGCKVAVSYGPPSTSAGAGASRSANLQVSYAVGSAPGSTPYVTLTGAASNTVYFSTTNLNLGTATTAKPSTATLTIINFEGSSITVSAANPTGANAAEFTYAANTCGTTATPVNLAPNQTCSMNVTFTPAAASEGARSANFTVTYSLSGAQQTQAVNLTGTGQ
jgi:hypothetical protein